jgi:uncharacterized protein YgbK (DUF1537 family)
MTKPMLGCIADDLTGATDLANNLVRAGMRVILIIDVPEQESSLEADAIVIALKSRAIPASDAIAQSVSACRWLRGRGARTIFKICSTFDSTPQGNIGPVIEALMEELDCDFTTVVPAFPDNHRTVYQGHLFVRDVLLSESSMRNHPLTPMTDSNLVRFLQLQLNGQKNGSSKLFQTGLLNAQSVTHSAQTIRQRLDELRCQGVSIAIADTVTNDDLQRLAAALCEDALLTAGSGLAICLPAQWGFHPSCESAQLPPAKGRQAILAGSCSSATNAQVHRFLQTAGAAFLLDCAQLVDNYHAHIEQILAWAETFWQTNPTAPLLVYSTAEPAAVESMQRRFGVEQSGQLIEHGLSDIARAFVARGVAQLIVAGGETSGVCARAIGAQQMQIGPQIDPGVPWCYASSTTSPHGGLHLTLKSGNFGSQDFFTKAFSMIEGSI